MSVQPVPEGYQMLIPYLAVDDAADAIEYYKKAFGAKERARMDGPDGKIGHAELDIGNSVVMLADPFPHASTTPPSDAGATTAAIVMYVQDVDAVVTKAVDEGATITEEVEDKFSEPSRTRSGTSGRSGRTSRTFRRRRWPSAPSRPWPR
jgi:PhnB protein